MIAALFGALALFSGLGLLVATTTGLPSAYVYAALWVVTYGLAILQIDSARVTTPLVLLLPVAALLSSALSDRPAVSMAYAAMFGLSILTGAALARVASIDEMLDAFWKLAAVMGAVSLLGYALDLPTFRYFDALGRTNVFGLPLLRGLFSHKTDAGRAMVCALVVVTCLRPKFWIVWATGFAVLLALSGSAGAIAFGAVSIAVGAIFLIALPFSKSLTIGIGLVWAIILMLIVPDLPALEGVMGGRDLSTLTGRTSIWQAGLLTFPDHPILGFGYFQAIESPYFLSRLSMLNDGTYQPPHFHNVYVQFLMDMGWVGLGLFLLTMGVILRRLLRWSRTSRPAGAQALFLIMMFLLANGLTEVTFAYNTLGSLLIGFVLSPSVRPHSR